MTFKDFLAALVKDAHYAFKESILQSEENRKHHWEEKDGVLHPKSTKRMIGDKEVDMPEHTQHDHHSFPVTYMELETETHLSKSITGELKTNVKKGLFRRSPIVKIKMRFEIQEPPEGSHALNDSLNENLKEEI